MSFHRQIEFDASRAASVAADDEHLFGPFLNALRERRSRSLEVVEFGTSLTKGSAWLQAYGNLTLLETDGGDLDSATRDLARRGTLRPTAVLLHPRSDIAELAPDCIYSVMAFKNGPSHLYLGVVQSLLAAVAPAGCVLLHIPVRAKLGLIETRDTDASIDIISLEILYGLFRTYNYNLILAEEDKYNNLNNSIYFRIIAIRDFNKQL